MPTAPHPRKLLQVEGYWDHEDVLWQLPVDLDSALDLAVAQEQHALAFGIRKSERRHGNSDADLARRLETKHDTLWRKLSGRQWATPQDLLLWSWLVGGRERNFYGYTLKNLVDLVQHPVSLPTWPIMPRGRDR